MQDASCLVYPFFFVFRRFTLAVVAIWLNHLPWLQNIVYYYLTTAILIYLGNYRPLCPRSRNYIEMANEVFIFLIMYHFAIFSDFVPEADTRYTMGYSCFVIIGLKISFNLSLLLTDTIQKMVVKYKQRRKLQLERKLKQLKEKLKSKKINQQNLVEVKFKKLSE